MTEERIQQLKELLLVVETAIAELTSGKVKQYKIGERLFAYYELSELSRLRQSILDELRSYDIRVVKAIPEEIL